MQISRKHYVSLAGTIIYFIGLILYQGLTIAWYIPYFSVIFQKLTI